MKLKVYKELGDMRRGKRSKKMIRYVTLTQIYAQKFLSYIVCLISIYVVYLQIFFNLDKIIVLSMAIRACFAVLIVCLFFAIFGFAILTYRTSVELFAAELKIRAIHRIIRLVHNTKGIDVLSLYEHTDSLFEPKKGRIRKINSFFVSSSN